jgi:PAS domain S-box-containing protein
MRNMTRSDSDTIPTSRMTRYLVPAAAFLLATTAVLVLWELILSALHVSVPPGLRGLLWLRAVSTTVSMSLLVGVYVARVRRRLTYYQEMLRAQKQLDCAPITIVRVDPDARITHVNEAWRQFARDNGADAATIEGVGLNYVAAARRVYDVGAAAVADSLDAVVTGREDSFSCLYPCHAPSKLRWFRLAATRVSSDDAVVLMHIDVTDHYLAEARLHIQSVVAHALAEHLPLLESCRRLVQATGTKLDWSFAAIWMPDADRRLRCIDTWTKPGCAAVQPLEHATRAATIDSGRDLPGKTWTSRSPVWIADLGRNPDLPRASVAATAGIRSAFAVPIAAENELLAVLEFQSQIRREPDPVLLELLTAAGAQFVVNVKKVRAERAASETARRYTVLYQNLRDALVVMDPITMSFKAGNRAAVALFGARDEADLLARTPIDLAPETQPDGRISVETAREAITSAMREGSYFGMWTLRRLGGDLFPASILVSRVDVDGELLVHATVRDESRVQNALAAETAARTMLDTVMSCVPVYIMVIDTHGVIRFANRTSPAYSVAEIIGTDWLRDVPQKEHAVHRAALLRVISSGVAENYETVKVEPDGQSRWYAVQLAPLRDATGVDGIVLVAREVSDLRRAQMESEAARRLAAVGTLASGVAHEINTPIQFIGDSVYFLRSATDDCFTVMEKLSDLKRLVTEGAPPDQLQQAAATATVAEASVDLAYIHENIPKAFDRCAEGLERVSTIVRSMREFTHPGQIQMAPIDLNRAIQNTLTIARGEYKYVAEIELDLGDLPPVTCYINDINQVVLNLVVNAAHAIDEVVKGTDRKGTITVRTRLDGDHVLVCISDTGAGIPAALAPHVFEPFFTTKEVGKGTGQGLALAWQIVHVKHGGQIRFESRPGEGTRFFIRLPLAGSQQSEVHAGGQNQ